MLLLQVRTSFSRGVKLHMPPPYSIVIQVILLLFIYHISKCNLHTIYHLSECLMLCRSRKMEAGIFQRSPAMTLRLQGSGYVPLEPVILICPGLHPKTNLGVSVMCYLPSLLSIDSMNWIVTCTTWIKGDHI